MDLTAKLDELLGTDCYVVDFLPERVPRDSEGQYFSVEEFFLRPDEQRHLYRKFTRILLKINCYYDFQVNFHSGWCKNPEPAVLADWISQCLEKNKDYMNIILETADAMFIVNGDDLHLTLYHPDEKLRQLTEKSAFGEGLFLRKGIS